MPVNVLTVCTGNVCRSAMAQVILDRALTEAAIPALVDSAGISDEEYGNPMDRRAVKVLQEHGYEVPKHRARQVACNDLRRNQLVLAMTLGHYRSLMRLADDIELEDTSHIRMYRSFLPGMPSVDEGDSRELEIADPWYGGMEDFRETYDLLIEGVPYIVEYLAGLPEAQAR